MCWCWCVIFVCCVTNRVRTSSSRKIGSNNVDVDSIVAGLYRTNNATNILNKAEHRDGEEVHFTDSDSVVVDTSISSGRTINNPLNISLI